VEDHALKHDPFQPYGFSQSAGLLERQCTDAEVLHYMLHSEANRLQMERTTHDLEQLIEQSALATREAQNATRSKSDFLARMSHEIRTPLNGILGMTSALLSRDLSAADQDCVETIRTSGEALLAVVNSVLDFSKIEAGRMDLECADFQPAQVVAQAIQIIGGAAFSKSLMLETDIDPKLPRVVGGDMVRLRQVLLNLLGNAVKFTPRGSIQVQAELLSASTEGYRLRFSIADEGIGISEEQQRKLFQPFTQASACTTRKYGGTGLGLAICKQIVELMGGTIGVRSRPGAGSVFWFTVDVLPAAESTSEPSEEVVQAALAEARKADARILLVEDNPINQKVGLMMLKRLGYKADVASDGREALRIIESERYDLILMDVLMPEMDGLEATRLIRAMQGPGIQVPILAMTAGALGKDREACLEAGMSDYLSKPVREPELRQKLHHWLSGSSQIQKLAEAVNRFD
jgi:signal transduction histidine kinase/AmiR/NasT family two-component response regulator